MTQAVSESKIGNMLETFYRRDEDVIGNAQNVLGRKNTKQHMYMKTNSNLERTLGMFLSSAFAMSSTLSKQFLNLVECRCMCVRTYSRRGGPWWIRVYCVFLTPTHGPCFIIFLDGYIICVLMADAIYSVKVIIMTFSEWSACVVGLTHTHTLLLERPCVRASLFGL